MNKKTLLTILGIASAALVGYLVISDQNRNSTGSAGVSDRENPIRTNPSDTKNQIRPDAGAAPESTKPDRPNPDGQDAQKREVILNAIHEASIQYDPEQIPIIIPHLESADKEVRKAALDGLIVLGERGAAIHIRNAATRLEDPREATTFLEAADYLELPSFEFNSKKK